MIVFDLQCLEGEHRFEGWFSSSDDFDRQRERGLLCCPQCGSAQVEKAVMAPAVGRKGNAVPERAAAKPSGPTEPPSPAAAGITPEVKKALLALATMQKAALEKSTWVGRKFADEARAMHYGERDAAPIHGEASGDEAKELRDEGIEVMPLPFPVAPPDAVN